MSEIEKLMQNAGVEKDCIVMHECLSAHSKCENCNKTFYPSFTAEKQLELIKWIIKTNHRYFIQDIFVDNFSEVFASVFNLYWQNLTEEEKETIRGILRT